MALTNLSARVALGIDIGGTNTKFGVVNHRGEVLEKGSLKTDEYEKVEDFIDALYLQISPLIEKYGADKNFDGIGVGVPNGNYYTGTVEQAPNLPWKGILPFSEKLSQATHLKVVLNNDANAAAIGEEVYGGAKSMKDFAVITLGTGLGSGIVCGGKVLYGQDGLAGELGHIIINSKSQRLCGCGR